MTMLELTLKQGEDITYLNQVIITQATHHERKDREHLKEKSVLMRKIRNMKFEYKKGLKNNGIH